MTIGVDGFDGQDKGADRPKWRIETGLDRLVDGEFALLRQARVGVISNPTGVDRKFRHLVDLMHESGAVTITGVFGPEHGFRGSAQAGGSEGTGIDARTGLTVYDAYGATVAKWQEMFTRAAVEVVVFDIQDVGARFYTYIWTMFDSMAAAKALGLKYVVLDRPNPIGGRARGPMMTPGYTSGVGKKEIVQQHGMTVGELARFYRGEFAETAGIDLDVVACRGWRRDMVARDTDVPWVMPSPNMPTPDTALVYPGTGMFEGAHASEGRGTTRPFELIGAPLLDHHWCDRLNAHRLPGVRFREAYFTPTFNKHTGVLCAGVEVKVVDPGRFDAVRTGAAMLIEARRYPDFAWRVDAWDPVRPHWIDKLTGSTRLRTMIDAGAGLDEVTGAWEGELAAFVARRNRYLQYQ